MAKTKNPKPFKSKPNVYKDNPTGKVQNTSYDGAGVSDKGSTSFVIRGGKVGRDTKPSKPNPKIKSGNKKKRNKAK